LSWFSWWREALGFGRLAAEPHSQNVRPVHTDPSLGHLVLAFSGNANVLLFEDPSEIFHSILDLFGRAAHFGRRQGSLGSPEAHLLDSGRKRAKALLLWPSGTFPFLLLDVSGFVLHLSFPDPEAPRWQLCGRTQVPRKSDSPRSSELLNFDFSKKIYVPTVLSSPLSSSEGARSFFLLGKTQFCFLYFYNTRMLIYLWSLQNIYIDFFPFSFLSSSKSCKEQGFIRPSGQRHLKGNHLGFNPHPCWQFYNPADCKNINQADPARVILGFSDKDIHWFIGPKVSLILGESLLHKVCC